MAPRGHSVEVTHMPMNGQRDFQTYDYLKEKEAFPMSGKMPGDTEF